MFGSFYQELKKNTFEIRKITVDTDLNLLITCC